MPAARPNRTNSSSCRRPLRSRWASTRPSEVSSRCTSCSLLISSEKNATGTLLSSAALRDVEHESRLSHRRSRGDDDQIRWLETCRHFVEILESACDTRNRTTATLDLFDPLHRRPKQLLDARETFRAAALIDLEDSMLGCVEQLGRRRARLESFRHD